MKLRNLARWTFGAAVLALVLLVSAAFFLTPDCADEGCPALAALEAYTPPEPPHVYDRHGELVGQLPGPRRLVVGLEDIPPLVREGYVAVEDRRFWSHGGVDLTGIVRAASRNVRSGDVEEGASTITMQLVRNVFASEVLEYNRWHRKLTEARMALLLEDRLSKERILETYLNQIYLGGGVWGVETAARSFFGKPVAEVSVGEAALIVGLAKNPEGYNPRRNPDRARERRDLVLDLWVRQGLIQPWQRDEAQREELRLAPAAESGRASSWYLAAVDRRVRELFPDPRERQGLRIHTGLDPKLQAAADEALRAQIEAVESGAFGAFDGPRPPESGAERTAGASPYLQGMVLALDPQTGLVRALVGGRDFASSEFDRALLAERQPGSAFKPLAYAAAIERGLTLSERVETGAVTVRQAGTEPWSPADAGDGEPLTVREALARSSNTAAVRVGQRAGLENVVETARELGIGTPLPAYPSILLGSAEVLPVELVGAYAAFGNGGRRVVPHLVERIADRAGAVVWVPADVEPRPALDPAAAWLTLEALRGVVDGGTGWRVREAGVEGPAAGKTGTTDGARDVWFVGLTPDLVAGVWLGFDEPRPIVAGASGGALAAPVWGRMVRTAATPWGTSWSRPAGLAEVEIDAESGALAHEDCPGEQVRTEVYLPGTEPGEACPLHGPDPMERFWRGLTKVIRMGG